MFISSLLQRACCGRCETRWGASLYKTPSFPQCRLLSELDSHRLLSHSYLSALLANSCPLETHAATSSTTLEVEVGSLGEI